MRTLDPYQATRPFSVEREPFDFAAQGRDIEELLRAGEERKARRWEAPKFTFRENPEFKLEVDPITRQVREFKAGAAEDDPIFGLLGSGIEASGDATDPIDWGTKTLKGFAKGKSPARLMGSVASSLPIEEAKLGITGLKAGTTAMQSIAPAAFAQWARQRLGAHGFAERAIENAVKNVNPAHLDAVVRRGNVMHLGDIWDEGNLNPVDEDRVQRIVNDLRGGLTPVSPAERTAREAYQVPRARPDIPPSMRDIIKGRYTDIGKQNLPGSSPKTVLRTDEGDDWLWKSDPWSTNITGGGVVESASEHAGSTLANLMNPKVPIVRPVREGGTIQRMRGKPNEYPVIGSQAGRSLIVDPSTNRPYAESVKELVESHVDDTMLRNYDPHGEQFMVEPGGGIIPVDKGFNQLSGYKFNVRPDPQTVAQRGDLDTYLGLELGGNYHPEVDPQMGLDRADFLRSIKREDYETALDPMMRQMRLSDPERVSYMDNYERALDELPANLKRYYDVWMTR